MKNKNIVITTCPISTPPEQVWPLVRDERALINAICDYSKQLRKEGKEVFKRNKNIIAAEDGYYFAFYENELVAKYERVKEEKVLAPFIGEDGRQKIELVDKEGTASIEDVAIMVATNFVPNPSKYKYVKFKDNNPLNCNADNLYWSETE